MNASRRPADRDAPAPLARLCFGPVDHWLLIGGGGVLLETARRLTARGRRVTAFSAARHQAEPVGAGGATLADALAALGVPLRDPADINADPVFRDAGAGRGLAIGFGETWTFTADSVARFGERLLDLMGIPLPHYRGGAHYTWQILRRDRRGAAHLQLINEHMVQGEFDSGALVKSREYLLPAEARVPADYFRAAHREQIAFLDEFIGEVEAGRRFDLAPVPESASMHFPRLHTATHGWIDWSWPTDDIAVFICAFDEPYPGASTLAGGRRVHLGDARADYGDGPFHPFQRGLIFRADQAAIHVATRDGAIVLGRVRGEDGADMRPALRPGERLHTPGDRLEAALAFRAAYDAAGLVPAAPRGGDD